MLEAMFLKNLELQVASTISAFGTCTIPQIGCKMADALVSFLTRVRRFLASAGCLVKDNEMVHALQAGLSGSFSKVA